MSSFQKTILTSAIIGLAALAIAGGLIWHFSRSGEKTNLTADIASSVGSESSGSLTSTDLPNAPEISPQDQISYNDEIIPLLWTDNNDNENLIIKTDKKYYDASSQVIVYFSIANQTQSGQKTDIYFWFDGTDKKVAKVEKIVDNKISNVKLQILNVGENPPQPSLKGGSNSPPLGGVRGDLNLQGLKLKDIKDYTIASKFNDEIAAGQINYYKATIKSPAETKQSEFFIEAFGSSVIPAAFSPRESGEGIQTDESGSPRIESGASLVKPGMTKEAAGMTNKVSGMTTSDAYDAYGHLDPYLAGGLVGYWTFNGPTIAGTQVYDQSGNYATGTMTGGPTKVAGVTGQALSFDGTNGGRVTVTSLTSALLYTVSVWAKTTSASSRRSLVGFGTDSANANAFELQLDGSNDFFCFDTWSVSCYGISDARNRVANGEWHHIVGEFHDSDWASDRMWLDGVEQSLSVLDSGMVNNPLSTQFGVGFNGWVTTSGRTWLGLIDEVRVYNRSLSADEIRHLYVSGQARINTSQAGRYTDGLVGEWIFDAPTIYGTNVYDQSGSYATGTISGATKTAGVTGQALKFDGVDDYVNMGSPSSLDNIETQGGGGMTISVWLNPKGPHNQDEGYIIGKQWDEVGFWRLYAGSNGFIVFDKDYLTTDLDAVSSVSVLSRNTWTHLVFSWDGSTSGLLLYKNGSPVSWTPSGGTGAKQSDANLNLTIGDVPGYAHNFNGLIDEVRIYNRALSADEVKKLYTLGSAKINSSQNSKITDGLVGLWSFDGNDIYGTTAIDWSGQNNNGTLTGANGLPKKVAGKLGQALSFDGVDDYVAINQSSSINNLDTLTLSAWIYLNSYGKYGYGRILSKEDDGFAWLVDASAYTTNGFDFSASRWATDGYWSSPVNSILTGRWYHVAVTYDYSSLSNNPVFYINGSQVTAGLIQSPAGAKNSESANLLIGNDYGVDRSFNGLIDEVRVYNRALSADEIKRLYNMGR